MITATLNNKLIAEFMEYPTIEFNGQTIYVVDHYKLLIDSQLNFSEDWNFLMEVVEKIKPLVWGFEICKRGTIIFRFKEDNTLPSISFSNKDIPQITTVYNACVEFIKWYNQQTAGK